MPLTADEIAKHIDGEVLGDGSIELSGFAPADKARAGDMTFAENQTYFNRAEQSAASAIMVDGQFASAKKTLIRVPNARIAFAKVLPLFFPEPTFAPGIHPTAVLAPSAQVENTAHIGPHCVIGEQVHIGARCVLHGGNHVGAHCVLGADTQLFPNVVLYPRTQVGQRVRIHAGAVIGSDGFGYVLDSGAHRKVPQIGITIIQDDVEIGANTTIDRGALGPTSIGRGTKIDNLVQIAHNVTLAGQVGLAGHLKIGNKATVAAQSGVMHDIPDGEKWFGYPAQPDRQTKRQILAVQQLPELVRRMAELEKKLAEATGGANGRKP